MKNFLNKCFYFILPLSIFFIEIFLPIDTFTYRPWETLLYVNRKGNIYPFYPNKNLKMTSVGDLCYYTDFSIKKKEYWITDKLGYRNNYFIDNSDILLIGDSFVLCSSIDQDSTLTNTLKKKLNTEVYNIAPASFSDFLFFLNNNILKKPKLIIFSIVERSFPEPINIQYTREKFSELNYSLILQDLFSRQFLIKYFKSRILGTHGKGKQGIKDTTMFFLMG